MLLNLTMQDIYSKELQARGWKPNVFDDPYTLIKKQKKILLKKENMLLHRDGILLATQPYLIKSVLVTDFIEN